MVLDTAIAPCQESFSEAVPSLTLLRSGLPQKKPDHLIGISRYALRAEADLDGNPHEHIEIQAWELKVVQVPIRKPNAADATNNRRSTRQAFFNSHVQVVSPKQRLRRTFR